MPTPGRPHPNDDPDKRDPSPFHKGDPKPTENPDRQIEEVPPPEPIDDPVVEPPKPTPEPGRYVDRASP